MGRVIWISLAALLLQYPSAGQTVVADKGTPPAAISAAANSSKQADSSAADSSTTGNAPVADDGPSNPSSSMARAIRNPSPDYAPMTTS